MPSCQNPTFDKDAYWERRHSEPRFFMNRRVVGTQRGQGLPINPVTAHHFSPDWPMKPVTKKARLKNSKRARRELTLAAQ